MSDAEPESGDVFEIGLGNDDQAVRNAASEDYVSFWEGCAKRLFWFKMWDKTLDWQPPFARWFQGGKINAAYNLLDVHQERHPAKTAIIWEGEDGESTRISYGELHRDVGRAANMLRTMGVKKGDRVALYLPMIPQLIISMIACARIGAIHTVVFSGFSAAALRDRLEDAQPRVIITADGGLRRGKAVRLKETAAEAASGLDFIQRIIVYRRMDIPVSLGPREILWEDAIKNESVHCQVERLDSTHPLFILYTSGTTGKPKGVLHGTGGYLTHLHATFKWAFDIKDEDVYFCTADIGWVTGHSYVAYGPLLHGATQLIYEGAPDYPDASRMWSLLQKYNVSIFYTTPTAIRMLMKAGDRSLDDFDLSRLRLLGSVGEPINPEVWKWYYDRVGKRLCPIIDTWWQTETGGMMISALPGIETIPLKPGSGTREIPGVSICVVDENGREAPPGAKGHLVIRNPWPGMLLTLWQNNEKYKDAYWSKYQGYYTGDYAIRDHDGYLWLLGRADDVLKIAGHRIGTAELESSIVSHPDVAESAVCAVPDEIKGSAIAAFAVLHDGASKGVDELRGEIRSVIRGTVGAIATPKQIYFLSKLPKTRSGKIMRRLLGEIACGKPVGDTSTLEDSSAVAEAQRVVGSASHAGS